MPAVVRVVIAHADDELDPIVRFAAERLRAQRSSPEESLPLFDWEAGPARPELFVWLLELSGDPGTRPPLVAAAVRAGAISGDDAARLAAPLERPAWADGEVPWELDGIVEAGEVPAARRAAHRGRPVLDRRRGGIPVDDRRAAGVVPCPGRDRLAPARGPRLRGARAAVRPRRGGRALGARANGPRRRRLPRRGRRRQSRRPGGLRRLAARGRVLRAAAPDLGDHRRRRRRDDRPLQRPPAAPALPDVGRDGVGRAGRRRHRPRPARARARPGPVASLGGSAGFPDRTGAEHR